MHRMTPIAVGLMLLLSACAVPATQQPSARTGSAGITTSTQPPLQKLNVIMVCCYLSDAAFLIAQEEGYFAEQGLEIEVSRFASVGEGLAALLTGQVDVMGGGLEPGIFNAIARGEALKIVADKGQSADDCDYTSAAVRTADLEKWNAGNLEQLRHAKVAAAGNQPASFYVDSMLQALGLSLGDLDVVDVPAPNRVESLVSGAVDLSLLSEPWVTRALDTGQVSLFRPAREVGSSVQLSAWVLGESLLNDNRELGQRFINAYLKGLRQFSEGKTQRNIEVLASGTKLEPELVERVCWPKLALDGQINLEHTELYQAWLVSNGWLDERIDVAQYWDSTFVEQGAQVLSGEGR